MTRAPEKLRPFLAAVARRSAHCGDIPMVSVAWCLLDQLVRTKMSSLRFN